jgi:hypothetical protein
LKGQLPAEIIDKPQNQRQHNRDYYAACYRKIYSPVFAAELQIPRQSEKPQFSQNKHQAAHYGHYYSERYQPLTDLLRAKFHIFSIHLYTAFAVNNAKTLKEYIK